MTSPNVYNDASYTGAGFLLGFHSITGGTHYHQYIVDLADD